MLVSNRYPAIARWLMQRLPGRALRRIVWSSVRRREFDFEAALRFGGRIRGNTRDLIQRDLYFFGVWEPSASAWIRARLSLGDTFVDVGANIGYYTLLGAGAVGPRGSVVAVEAYPEIFARLEETVTLNELANVRLCNLAATDEAREVPIYFGGEDNSGSSSIVDSPTGDARSRVVRGLPLSTILTREEKSRARLIKIDVEGAERQVIAGLDLGSGEYRRELELIVEITPERWADRGDPGVLLEQLRSHGYNAYRLDDPHSFRHYLPNQPTRRPERLRDSVRNYATLVFSRVDADSL